MIQGYFGKPYQGRLLKGLDDFQWAGHTTLNR